MDLFWTIYQKSFSFFYKYGFYNNMDDKRFLSKKFRAYMHEKLDWNDPKTFNQKLQWLKLNDRKPEYTVMVDKYLVRQYIADKIGADYLIPLLGVYDDPDEIDFDLLPDQFVLKCNHNSGKGMYLCRDKQRLDIEQVKRVLRRALREDYFLCNREWPYKNVQRKIIAEKFMVDYNNLDPGNGLIDYKFYCFNGEPHFLYVSKGLDNHETARIVFLNMDWSFAGFKRSDFILLENIPQKPVHYEKMIELSRKLSANIPFLRVDLYEINGKVYFGELTFSPCAGLMPFEPPKADFEVGEMLDISMIREKKDLLRNS